MSGGGGWKVVHESPVSSGGLKPGWVAYFLGVAEALGARGDCKRRKVGAVAVGRRRGTWRIAGAGYNGRAPGLRGCLEGACPRGGKSYAEVPALSGYAESGCDAVHAEVNAMDDVAWWVRDASIDLYVTCQPCVDCSARLLADRRVRQVFWPEGYMMRG